MLKYKSRKVNEMETKICSKCGKELPATTEYFHKNKFGKYGLQSVCKKCKYEVNKEKSAEYFKKYYDENKQELLNYQKKFREENENQVKETQKQYYKKNKEKVKEKSKKYKSQNHESVLKYQKSYNKKYNRENKEMCNIQTQRRITRKKSLPSTLTFEQWENTKNYFGNKCAYCGKELHLTQEHFIPVSKGGGYTADNIIPSCQSCNSSKYNKDFFEWYPKYRYYSKKRERFILEFLGLDEQEKGSNF